MDPIKESFNRVKEDMDTLRAETEEIKKSLIDLCQIIEKMAKKEKDATQFIDTIMDTAKESLKEPRKETIEEIPTHGHPNQTNQHTLPTYPPYTDVNVHLKPLFSTGNRGVPTDRQTHQQTDRQTDDSIENAAEMLKSLDNIKREIRQKFKKLTEQEWMVFSTIYQIDGEAGYSDYKILADRLKLTESSIRDYVGKLIKKGIPVEKTKLNNKNIRLSISPNLKQIASLSTIITLRDL